MESHHAALLLLGIFVLWMEPISAKTARTMEIRYGNLHNETEASEEEITLKSPAPSVEALDAPPRPGECPNPTLPGLPHPSQAYCMAGQPCPGDEKCCRVGNIMKCVLPVGVHRGYCPWPERAVASSESCTWDSDCALDEKCCPIEGHQRCAKAMPANPGLCPKRPLPPALFTCKSKCEDDRSCPEGQKCCFVECGPKCVPPESPHGGDRVELDRNPDPEGDHRDVCLLPDKIGPCKGFFPRFFFNSTSGKCEQFIYGGCGGNANNFLTMKKCLHVCSREEKEGLCPARAPPGAIDPCFGRCSNDSQCPGKTKCCQIECGMACLEPLSEKEGMCPVIAPSCVLSSFFIQCFRDSQCPGRMKCCHAACARVCLEPVPEPPRPGECPNPTQPGLPRPLLAYCAEGKPCPGDEKCCRVGNVLKCVLPVGVHRGYCPRREGDENGIKICSSDTDCAWDKKCCPSEGPQMCTKPVPANPGLCPKKALPLVFTPCKDSCRDDRSCLKGQKCCFVGCGLKCVLPESHDGGDRVELDIFGDGFSLDEDEGAPAKPGECPSPTLPGLPRPIQAYCVEDEPCPGDEKCCRVGNIMKCTLPVGVHPGYCPRRESEVTPAKSCSWDTDCAKDEKCCPSEGDQRCTKAVPANPGLCPKKALLPVLTPCQDMCRDDRSCPDGQKCCFVDCGLKCVPPESHLSSGGRVELDRDEDVPLLDGGHGDVCLLPSDQGDCDALFPRFFFNSTSGKCEKFVYGGCGGNANNFVTKEKCLRVCAGQDVCLLPSDQGDCEAHIPRFFHNSTSGECEKFVYGGCGGNENNFLNKEECLQVCSGKEKDGAWRSIVLLGKPDDCFTRCSKKKSYPSWWKFCQIHCAVACVEPQPDHCLLPPNPGDCREHFTRFFYNPAARRCQKFVYTGCGGNKNNFQTREECLRVCAHVAPRKPGMCPSRPLHEIPRSGQAFCMDDSACPGDEKCCQIGNITKCVLPLEASHPGYCPSNGGAAPSSPRCFWDTDCATDEKCCPSQGHKKCTKAVPATPGFCPKKCLPWVFTRCANKCKDDRSCPDGFKCCFHECGLRCVPPEDPRSGQQMEMDQDQALLVPEVALGEKEDTCPLSSVLDEPDPCLHLFSLQTRCPRKWRYCQIDYGAPGLELQPDYCLLPPERGNCHREVVRFFYDSIARKCKKFIYGGCGANENNFLTNADCLRVCEGAVTPKPGDCPRETFPEYQPLTYDYCFEDAACPGEEKCCRVGSVRKCVLLERVHRGYCPEKKGVALSSKSCSSDTDCASNEKCCLSERRKRCTKAVPEKPGLCPMKCFARVFSRCKNECEDDRSCPEGKKCCFADCGLKCVPAVNRHGGHRTAADGNCGAHLLMTVGECPRPKGAGSCVELCTGDESCGPGEKCCSNGCGHVCMKVSGALPSRPVGKCPKPQGPGICVEECASDESCGPGEKCCSNGCGHVCTKVSGDFCKLPSDPGSCNGTSVLRVSYNSQTGRCEKFPYSGCGGNKNNFATQLECLRSCSDRGICRLPMDQGWGDALRTRYFYNSTSRTCESFFYRGHRGNANNFWQKEDCLRFCVTRAESGSA